MEQLLKPQRLLQVSYGAPSSENFLSKIDVEWLLIFLEMSLLYPQKNYGAALRMSVCLSRGECFYMEEEERLFYEYIIERVSVLYIGKSL